MKKVVLVTLTMVIVLSGLFFNVASSPAQAGGHKILDFDSMVGIPAGLTGAQSLVPLRGINGGGLPWTLTSAKGSLKDSGALKIEVQGLVLAAGANVGSNPIASFRGLVSCVNNDGSFTNILTDPFPATTGPATSGGGDAEIEAMVALPHPCIAPIIFVTSPSGAWFAATGK